MSCSIPGTGELQALTDNQIVRLTGRVKAVQRVTEMATTGATRLLAHSRQLQSTIDQLSNKMESIPVPARVGLLVERLESAQAMLDWFTTKSARNGHPMDIADLQTRLSMSRVALVNVQAEVDQATMLARGVREIRETLAGLLSEIETLASTKTQAESLLLESKMLTANLER